MTRLWVHEDFYPVTVRMLFRHESEKNCINIINREEKERVSLFFFVFFADGMVAWLFEGREAFLFLIVLNLDVIFSYAFRQT